MLQVASVKTPSPEAATICHFHGLQPDSQQGLPPISKAWDGASSGTLLSPPSRVTEFAHGVMEMVPGGSVE